jgi:hypothetical protein
MISSNRLAEYLVQTVNAALPQLQALPDGPGTAVPNRKTGIGWSRRQELGHLIDSAVNNHIRIVRALVQGSYEGPGYEQDAWIDAHRYQDQSWTDLVDIWHAHNRILVPLVANIPTAALAAQCRVGGGAPVTLEYLIDDYVLHLRHHLDQILRRDPVTKYPRD